jgi:hypothetical protein
MGQQQLLLIVLGVIIVGIAIIVGIGLFQTNARQADLDNTIIQVASMASMAQAYYLKPKTFGGGGHSYLGWSFPLSGTSLGGGKYRYTTNNTVLTFWTNDAQYIRIIGYMLGYENISQSYVRADIYPDTLRLSVVDNVLLP